MGKSSEQKTNVMRILDQANAVYAGMCYAETGAISGSEVADALGEDHAHVFKTLVTVGKSGEHYVFVIPVDLGLNLKKAAAAANEKSIEMIKQKELLPLTGYIHGGCSPIGMKKPFRTFIHNSAESLENIVFSAGKIGYQIKMSPDELKKVIPFSFADIAE
ncbi:MAG: Cys-tRNA(Pro) deacylase [Firmicutes bacterium]|nr:Cys-tRNA(Pro) deacylase [Bacillota bacterium]